MHGLCKSYLLEQTNITNFHINPVKQFKENGMLQAIRWQFSHLLGRNGNKSKTGRYVLSYLSVILICTVVMTTIIYYYLDKKTEKTIIDANNSTLLNFRNTTDIFIIKNLDSIGLSMLSADDIFLELFTKPLDKNMTAVLSIYNKLKALTNLNPIITDISVYYKENGVVISTKGIIYLKSYQDKPDTRDIEWIKQLDSMKTPSQWLEPRKTTGKESSRKYQINTITQVRKYPVSYNTCLGGIAISFDESKLLQLIKNTASENIQQIFIVNKNGLIISHSDENLVTTQVSDLPYWKGLDDFKNGSGYFVTFEGNKKVIVSYAPSSYNGWTYVTVNYTDQLSERYKFFYVILLYFVISIIVTCIFALLLSLKRIRKANSEVTDLSSRIKEQENEIQKNRSVVKQNFYLNLINGIYQKAEEIEDQLQLLKIDFKYPYYVTAVIKLYRDKSSDLRAFEYTKFKSMEYAENVLTDMGISCLCTQNKKDIILIMGLRDSTTNYREIIRQLCGHIYSELGLKACAGLGENCSDLIGIADSYQQAMTCINYCFLYGEKLILSYNEIIPLESSKNKIPDTCLEQFTSNIRLRNKKEAILAIHQLTSDISHNTYSYSHTMTVLRQVISSLEKFGKNIYKDPEENEYPDLFYSLSCCEDITDFTVLVENVLDTWIATGDSYSKTHNKELVEKIKLYISSNLQYELISLNSIADVMHISPNYLSRIFKEETGMYFIDYLTEARLEMSKDLLLCSDMTIERISEITGYSSLMYYNRKFKARYGVTPKQYRIENILNGI